MRIIALIFALLVGAAGHAASFDCAKASAEIEHAICNNAELSRLDEEIAHVYGQLGRDNRYYDLMRDDQRQWLLNDRVADPFVFEQRLQFLHQFVAIADCLDPTDSPHDCKVNANDALDYCMSGGNYSTYAMDNCSASQARVLDMLLDFETTSKRDAFADDPETQELFDEAARNFNLYRDSECSWQYSEYRDGTIRGQIYFGCYLDMTSKRVFSLRSANMIY